MVNQSNNPINSMSGDDYLIQDNVDPTIGRNGSGTPAPPGTVLIYIPNNTSIPVGIFQKLEGADNNWENLGGTPQHSEFLYLPDSVDTVGSGGGNVNGWRARNLAATGTSTIIMAGHLEKYVQNRDIEVSSKLTVDNIDGGNLVLRTEAYLAADGISSNVAPIYSNIEVLTGPFDITDKVFDYRLLIPANNIGNPVPGTMFRVELSRLGGDAQDTLSSTVRWINGVIKW